MKRLLEKLLTFLGFGPSPSSPTVWLRCDLPATIRNFAIGTPLVAMILVASVYVPEVRGCFWFMAGVWWMGLHNVVWAILSRENGGGAAARER